MKYEQPIMEIIELKGDVVCTSGNVSWVEDPWADVDNSGF